ncbi:serine hydrolase [Caballeronia sp. GaOx3]|uniref:serine hydrolase n=1 Tax=Caballeronia sp. GaOx3 TaxID=2921740 RepID=UPI0020283C08|nr:serine hydrolase [Caballeronia sp. GaOx3]
MSTTTPLEESLAREVNGFSFSQFIERTLQDYGVPGAVVVVASDQGTEYLEGHGVRRRGDSAPVDGNTRFQIASMSKFVTATAVGALVDKRAVSWDAPVRTFSSETVLADAYATENVTLRDFFAHRTGLPKYGDLLPRLVEYGPEELLHRARYLPFATSFRFGYEYTNYGIFLGQCSAARAAGMSPPQLLSQTILEPLGMTRSAPVQTELFKDNNHAAAHNLDGSVMPHENVDSFSGAGAIVSTGRDLARWMMMLLAEGSFGGVPILHEDTVRDIFSASMVGGPISLLGERSTVGLGCESYPFLRWRVVEKNGALNGMRSVVTLIPELRVGIAILANKQMTVFPEAVRAEFLERVLAPSGRDLQKQIHEEQKGWESLVVIPTPPADAQPLMRELDAFTGSYVSPLYGALEITRDGAGFAVKIGEHDYPAMLAHWSGDTFLLRFDDPDIAPGLLKFHFEKEASRASSFDGAEVPPFNTVNYGHFDRT